jgi:hypothetical protein
MLLAENSPFNNAVDKPKSAVQVDVIVAVKLVVTHVVSGVAPQSPNTTGPVTSVMLESRRMFTPVKALDSPIATMLTTTDVGDDCVKVTVADPAGDPEVGVGLSWATFAVNRRRQRLGINAETAIADVLAPKLEPSNVMV